MLKKFLGDVFLDNFLLYLPHYNFVYNKFIIQMIKNLEDPHFDVIAGKSYNHITQYKKRIKKRVYKKLVILNTKNN